MEIDQLRERNKELEKLAHLGHGLRFISKNISVSDYAYKIHVQEMDALYAKLFPPKPPEAKFKVGQWVKVSNRAAYPITKSYCDDGKWKYYFALDPDEDDPIWSESMLSALSEEEAKGK